MCSHNVLAAVSHRYRVSPLSFYPQLTREPQPSVLTCCGHLLDYELAERVPCVRAIQVRVDVQVEIVDPLHELLCRAAIL
eukprot:6080104-Prymnesium_polylepis.1